MSKMQFCYSCRVHHPQEQMCQYQTRHGLRWRCLNSIASAQRSAAARDEFGRQQTAINRELSRRQAEFTQLLRSQAYSGVVVP